MSVKMEIRSVHTFIPMSYFTFSSFQVSPSERCTLKRNSSTADAQL